MNNAGFFFVGEAVDADPERANAMLQLHVVTPSLLCTRFGRDMRARGRGHVLIVSSISAWRDFPGIGYYGSSKKYLRGFARSLRCELGVHGVNVTCLAPGATATGLYDPNVVPVERAKQLGVMMDAEAVADAGLGAMFAREAEHIPGRLTRLMTLGAVLAPQSVIDLLRRHAPAWLRARRGADDQPLRAVSTRRPDAAKPRGESRHLRGHEPGRAGERRARGPPPRRRRGRRRR